MTLEDPAPPTRRRGAALEAALLDAAWAVVVEQGYTALTFQAVAERAQTSRAVVYRRWATKQDLVRAAAVHASARDRRPPPDTGSLRGDVLALLHEANATRAGFAAAFSLHLAAYFQETGSSPRDLRELILAGHPPTMQIVLARAAERGEIPTADLPPRIATLPADLFRHEVLMTLQPVPDSVLEEIVDEMYLPLVHRAAHR